MTLLLIISELLGMLILAMIAATISLLAIYILAGVVAFGISLLVYYSPSFIGVFIYFFKKKPNQESDTSNNTYKKPHIAPYIQESINGFNHTFPLMVIKALVSKISKISNFIQHKTSSRSPEHPNNYAPNVVENEVLNKPKKLGHKRSIKLAHKPSQHKPSSTFTQVALSS